MATSWESDSLVAARRLLAAGEDVDDAADREIGVIHRGRLYAVAVSDGEGQPLSLRTLG